MRIRHRVALGAAAIAAAALPLTTVHRASAHAVIPVGNLTVAIGWLHEPAYLGFDNAVQVFVKDDKGNPLSGITDTDLQVEVSLGSQKMQAKPLVPTFDSDTGLGLHGEYEFHLIPTAPGNFSFHVFGRIAGSTPIDQTITASPTTFNEVQDQSAAQFPNQVPASSDLSQKIAAVSGRVTTVAAAQADLAGAQRSADDAHTTANRALALGIVALGLGIVLGGGGLIAALRGRGSGSM